MDILTNFDQEQYDRIRRREGFDEGAQQKAVEDAIIAIKEFHATPEDAAQKMGAPLDLVLEGLQKDKKGSC